MTCFYFFFSSRRRHTRYWRDWSSDVCSSDLRVLHVAHDRALAAQTLLATAHLVLAVRQRDRQSARDGPARQDCVSVKRLRVLSRGDALKPAPLAQVDVARRERVAHPQGFGDLARDVSVARTRHAVVQLRQKQNVAPAHQRVLAEHGDDFVETYAALDVPGGRAYRTHVAERLARLRTRREVSALDSVQHALDLRAQARVERRRFERLRRMKPCEFREVLLESVFERRR